MKQPIGIDLGTTNSCVAYLVNGELKLIELEPDDQSRERLMPSVIAEQRGGSSTLLVGAKARDAKKPLYRYGFVKRYLGTDVTFQFNGRVLNACEISGQYLKAMKERTEAALKHEVAAVITVPAHFETLHVDQTREAAALAELEVIDIIREPVAAALSWLRQPERASTDPRRLDEVLVFDLGGGTMDASVCTRSRNRIEVGAKGRAYAGDKFLGGYDFDRALLKILHDRRENDLLSLAVRNEGEAVAARPWLWTLLREAEKVKKSLSVNERVNWDSELENPESGDELKICEWITRSEFEDAIQVLLDRTLRYCREALLGHALYRGKLREKDLGNRDRERAALEEEVRGLSAVLLVGGSTRVPAVRKMLEKFLESCGAKHVPIESHDPDFAVALGAAVYAEQRLAEGAARATLAKGDVGIRWESGPTGRVAENNEKHPPIHGFLTGGSASWSVQLECGPVRAVAPVNDNAEFSFDGFPIERGQGEIVIVVKDDDDKIRGEFRYDIERQGLAVNPGSSLSKQIYLRTLQRRLPLFDAGLREGRGKTQNLLTTGDHIRLPVFEGHTEHLPIEIESKDPPGTPVKISPSYMNGKITLTIDIGGRSEVRTVQLASMNLGQSDDVRKKAMEALGRTEDLLNTLPAEGRERLQNEFDLLRLDIETELENPAPDTARIEDRLQQLDTLAWSIRAFSNTREGLRLFALGVANYMRRVKRDDLVKRVQDLIEELDQNSSPAAIDANYRRLWGLLREAPMEQFVVTEANVKELGQVITRRLKKVELLAPDEGVRAHATEFLLKVSDIQNAKRQPEERYRDLRDFEFHAVNELYREIVLVHHNRGLLSEG